MEEETINYTLCHVYDQNGYFLYDSFKHVENSTVVELPQPCWKPRWNGLEWIETATEEEKNPPPVQQLPTVDERISSLDVELLTTQVALVEQYEVNQQLNEELTNTQVAIAEIFEIIGGE